MLSPKYSKPMRFSHYDAALIIILLAFAGLLTAFSSPTKHVQEIRFYADNDLVKTVTIGRNTNKQYVVDVDSKEGNVRFEVQGQRVRAIDADCPNHTCAGMGWKSKPGHFIVCAPNRIFAVLSGEDDTGIDALAR